MCVSYDLVVPRLQYVVHVTVRDVTERGDYLVAMGDYFHVTEGCDFHATDRVDYHITE